MSVGRPSEARPLPPREGVPLGTLPRNIDVYHSLIWGSRDALSFGLIVAVSTALFGILYGAISGFVGNRLGSLMIRVADSFLALPPIAGLVFLQQLYGLTITAMRGMNFEGGGIITRPLFVIQYLLEHVNPLMLSLIILSWMPYARLVNSIVISLKQTDFVQATRALGGGASWIIRKHLLPNSTGPAIVLAGTRDVGGVVVLQATLTLVDLGGFRLGLESARRGGTGSLGRAEIC